MRSEEVYQQHLNKVSRSFAFCIDRLDLPLKAWVGLTYLLCRILDTIEDASWDSSLTQQRQFQSFDQFLKGDVSKTELKKQLGEWTQKFPASIPIGEKELIEDSERIFLDLHDATQPGSVRSIIQKLGRSMSLGMQHFSRQKQNGQLRLKKLTEVNQYCFFVAGLVGEALARLLAHVEPKFRLVEQRVLEAHHFGLFLQKVNLLKDQLGDEKEGRHLIPDRQKVLDSLQENVQGAFRFLNHLPQSQKSFRLFCAWSLFLGLGTLAVGQRAFKKGESAKLDRKDAERLLAEIEKHIDRPDQLEKLFFKLGREINMSFEGWQVEPQMASSHPSESKTWWLTEIYEGELAQNNFKDLGLVDIQVS